MYFKTWKRDINILFSKLKNRQIKMISIIGTHFTWSSLLCYYASSLTRVTCLTSALELLSCATQPYAEPQ